MMRGKSPRSDVEMSIKLDFVAAILDFCHPSWIENEYWISQSSIWSLIGTRRLTLNKLF